MQKAILRPAGALLLGLLTGVALSAGLLWGGHPTSIAQVLEALSTSSDDLTRLAVLEVRLPRTIAALVAGVGLGVAGSLLQVLTKNPLADAGLLGSNAGAALAVAASAVFVSAMSPALTASMALLGALAATSFVSYVGLRARHSDPVRLILVGVSMGAVLSGITSAIALMWPAALDHMRHWQSGSVATVEISSVLPAIGSVAVGVGLCCIVAKPLELSRLGDELASALGVNLRITRLLSVIAVACCSGGATAIAGPIGFVGLLAAHSGLWVSRKAQVNDLIAHLIAGSFGAMILVGADIIGRVMLRPGELPAGVVASVAGAPWMLWIIWQTRKGQQ